MSPWQFSLAAVLFVLILFLYPGRVKRAQSAKKNAPVKLRRVAEI
jgi:hypothetical protein